VPIRPCLNLKAGPPTTISTTTTTDQQREFHAQINTHHHPAGRGSSLVCRLSAILPCDYRDPSPPASSPAIESFPCRARSITQVAIAVLIPISPPAPRLLVVCLPACLLACLHCRTKMSSPSPAYPPYHSHRHSQSFDPNTPPAPPPKPSSQEVSRRSTPAGSQPLPPPPPHQQEPVGTYEGHSQDHQSSQQAQVSAAQSIQDPGEQWLPKLLEDKSYVPLGRLHSRMHLTTCPGSKIWPMFSQSLNSSLLLLTQSPRHIPQLLPRKSPSKQP
jgi:hypothetical protein